MSWQEFNKLPLAQRLAVLSQEQEKPAHGLTADPRWIEHRSAITDTHKGMSAPPGAHDRYRRALGPYVELMAEHCSHHPTLRKHMMRGLVEDGAALGVVLAAFRATKEEADFVRESPPVVEEPIDEIERLRRLPYKTVYLRTEHWKKVRAGALERAENRCQLCNSPDQLQVHHRTYDRRGAERPTDVIVLCDPCHDRHHDHLRAA